MSEYYNENFKNPFALGSDEKTKLSSNDSIDIKSAESNYYNSNFKNPFSISTERIVSEVDSFTNLMNNSPEDILQTEIERLNSGDISIVDEVSEEQDNFDNPIISQNLDSFDPTITPGKDKPIETDMSVSPEIDSVASIIKKFENVTDSTELGKTLIDLNNMYAIKYSGPEGRAAKYGAIDSEISAKDGLTWAQWPDSESMEVASKKIIEEMLNKDAKGDVEEFISNYIGQPTESKEVKSRYEEIASTTPSLRKKFTEEDYNLYSNNPIAQKELEEKYKQTYNVDTDGVFSGENTLDFKSWKTINSQIQKSEDRKHKKRDEVINEAVLEEDFELTGFALEHFEFTQDVNVVDEDKDIIREFLNYEMNTPLEEKLSYKEWKSGNQKKKLLEGVTDFGEQAKKSTLFPSDEELEEMVGMGYIDKSYLILRDTSGDLPLDPFGVQDRKYDLPTAMLSKNREYLRARLLYLSGYPPGSFDELPEEFWSTETAKGFMTNTYATLYELPMIPFEMIEPTGDKINRFLMAPGTPIEKGKQFSEAFFEPFILVWDIYKFFEHQGVNVSYAISPFATDEQKKTGLKALYDDPVAPILAAFGIKGVFSKKALVKLKSAKPAVVSLANLNIAKFKHAYDYYKNNKTPPKDLKQYVDIIEGNKVIKEFVEEQLSIDLDVPVKTIKKEKPVEGKPIEEAKVEEVKPREVIEEIKPIDLAKEIDPANPDVSSVKKFQEEVMGMKDGDKGYGSFGPKTTKKWQEVMGIKKEKPIKEEPIKAKEEPIKEEVKKEVVKEKPIKEKPKKLTKEESINVASERISKLIEKGWDNLSTQEKQLYNKLKNSRDRIQRKLNEEVAKGKENKELIKKRGRLEYRLKELEDVLVTQKDFLSSENIKSKTVEINELKKTIKNLDKDINKIVELHAGFDFITPLFGKKGSKGASESFLKWLRVKNDKGQLIKDGQLDIFDYIDETVHKGRFKSLLSSIDESIQKGPYPVNLKGVPDVNKYYELRGQFFGKGYVAEMYVNKILKDWKNYSSADLKQMYDVLNGTADIKTITNPQLLKEAKVVRTLIDELGQSLVDRNLLSKEAFESHKGDYIARIYEVYLNDKKNLTRFDDVPSIRRKYKFQRKDLGPEQKTALGEITDPSIPFSETVARSLTDIFANDLMQQTLNNPKWAAKGSFIELKNGLRYGEGYLRDLHKNTLDFIEREKRSGRKVSPETETMYKEITEALDKYDANPPVIDKSRFELAGKEYGILQGAYVDKGILRDFDVMRGDVLGVREAKTRPGKIIQNTRKFLTNWFKAAKVALNLPTVSRNIISATMQSAISGTGYYKQVKLIKPTIEGFLTKNKDWTNAAENGLFRGNFTTGELKFADRWSRELTQQVKDGVPYHEALVNLASKYLGKGKKAGAHVIGFYGKIDNYFKYTKYLDEIARGKSPVDATRLAQEALFDYSLVSPGMAMVREYFPFTTFFTKSVAFTVKNLRNHPVKAGLVMGTPVAYNYFNVAEKILKSKEEVTDSEYSAYLIANNKNLSEGGFITLPNLDENGNFQTVNLSMMQPHGAFFDIGGKLSHLYYADSIDDILGATGDAAKETVSNYSVNPVPTLMIAAMYGVVRTKNGTYEIFSSLDDNKTKIEKYSAFTRDLFMPSFIGGGDAGLIGEYLEIDSQSILKSDRTPNQIAASLMGVNIYPVDITKDVYKAQNIWMAKSSDLKREYNKELKKITLDIRLTQEEKIVKSKELTERYFLMDTQLIDEYLGPVYEKQLMEKYGTNNLKDVINQHLEKAKTLK